MRFLCSEWFQNAFAVGTPNLAGGAYSAPLDSLAGGVGWGSLLLPKSRILSTVNEMTTLCVSVKACSRATQLYWEL